MSELISGKEALIALANGDVVEYYEKSKDEWFEIRGNTFVSVFDNRDKFRLKPRTITINGIEVPAPFEPKEGEIYWYLTDNRYGYGCVENKEGCRVGIAAWRTEGEIKQVVAALRSIFEVTP